MTARAIRNILIIIVLMILSGWIGYNIGHGQRRVLSAQLGAGARSVGGTPTLLSRDVDLALFWDVWDRLSKSYIDKQTLDPQKMIYGAIKGMTASLDDPYTVFLPPKENKDAKDELGGQFEGIGAQLGIKDKRIVVIAPLRGMPAEKAGLKAGDWILKVDGKETTDWTLPEAVSKIRGPKGTKVTLTLLHEGEQKPIDIILMRDSIHVSSVEWEKVSVQCGSSCKIVKESCPSCQRMLHLRLTRFGDQTAQEWEKAVDEILAAAKKDEVKGLVFDLRNNPGGYLQGAIYIASEFLPDGQITTQQNSDGTKQVYEVNRKGKLLTQPMVILVNKGSASASEIVAGALKVRDRAKLVGQTTFGKGSVQDTQDLAGGAGLHVTVAKWLLPDGSSISGKGVDPQYKIDRDEEHPENDNQLEKAAEVLFSIK